MLQDFNIQVTPEKNLFIASDYHAYHDKDFIIGPRGFTDVEKYNEWLIESHNQKVRSQDTVLFLGDFLVGAGTNSWEKGNEILSRLNGNWLMLFGNHNSFAKKLYFNELTKFWQEAGFVCSEKLESEIYPLTHKHFSGKNVTFLGKFIEGFIKFEGGNFRYSASHYPITSWPDAPRGAISFSGHEHGNLKDWLPDEKHSGKKLDCGVDNAIKFNGSPLFSFAEIISIMNKKQYLKIGHH